MTGSISITVFTFPTVYSLTMGGIDFDDFTDLDNQSGLDFLKGPKGETGPQGPQGETGPQGPQGEQGPAGTPAEDKDLNIRTVEGEVVQNGASGGEHRKSVASCDSDEVLTGGGFKHTGNANYIMDFSRPNGNSWEAQGSPMSQDPSYTQAYAQCQKLIPSS